MSNRQVAALIDLKTPESRPEELRHGCQLVDCEGSRQPPPRWPAPSSRHADVRPGMPLCPLIPAVLGLKLAACAAPADLSLPTKPDSSAAWRGAGAQVRSARSRPFMTWAWVTGVAMAA